jgi:hypothetical protein
MAVRWHPLLWSLRLGSILFVADLGLAQDGLSYKVTAIDIGGPEAEWRLLTMHRTMVILSNGVNAVKDLKTPCSDFVGRTTPGRRWEKRKNVASGKVTTRRTYTLEFKNGQDPKHISIILQEGVDNGTVLRQLRDACATQQAEEPHLAQLDREEAAKRREAEAIAYQKRLADQQMADAKRKADFRDGILAALGAAEEPDPFASIRGDFDLSASDSREWKTSLQLAGADKCALLKTPPANPTSLSAWTFGCMFRASGEGYEGIVNLPYQPDEKAVNINQVFFADPSKPAWRVFVAKISEATIGISVVAVRAAGAPVDFNTAAFPAVPTMLPTEPTVRDEVEKIRSGRYAPMPPAQRSAAPSAGVPGRTTMTVRNSTAYELSVFFDGRISQKLTLAPGASQDLDLAPGTFRVAGRVAAANVLPFYGEETYAGSARYSVEFYIAP